MSADKYESLKALTELLNKDNSKVCMMLMKMPLSEDETEEDSTYVVAVRRKDPAEARKEYDMAMEAAKAQEKQKEQEKNKPQKKDNSQNKGKDQEKAKSQDKGKGPGKAKGQGKADDIQQA